MLPMELIPYGPRPPDSSMGAPFVSIWGWRAYAASELWRGQQTSTSVDISPAPRPDGIIRPAAANDRRPRIAHVQPAATTWEFTPAYAGDSAELTGCARGNLPARWPSRRRPSPLAVAAVSSADS